MDHFCINQICINCLRGKKEFKIELKLYDQNGRLKDGIDESEEFRFICTYCWHVTGLDFYKFSHPDMILHLKQLYEREEQRKKALDQLYIVFNNNNNNSK